ncbi:MAG: hypothetical protein WC408_00455 [Candidatus Micrarchaeia archaeon]|jgi:hypothetical protein
MNKIPMAIFALALLALFVLPVAATSDLPPAPNADANQTITSGEPNSLDPGVPPAKPGQRPRGVGTAVGNKLNGTVPQNNAAIQPQNRAQIIRDRVVGAIISRNETVNASTIKAIVANRIKAFDEAKQVRARINNTQDTQAFLLSARAFANTLNATQRQQLTRLAFGFINQSMDNRIDVAQKFGSRGMDNATINAYITASLALKEQIALANSTKARRDLVVSANRQWAKFKRDVVKDKVRDRLANATAKASYALEKLNAIIAQLNSNGTDTARLENISAKYQLRISRALEQNITIRQQEWRLAFARDGLAHLAAQVKAAVKKQTITDLPEETEPTELAIDDTTAAGNATGTENSDATQTTEPTAMPTATAEPTAIPTAAPTASETPTPAPVPVNATG